MHGMIRRSALVLLLVPSLALAQSIDTVRSAPTPFGIANGNALRPGRWTYDARIVSPGTPPHRISLRTVSVTAATYAGAPAWLIVDARQTRGVIVAESLYVDRHSLAARHHTMHTSDADLDVRFSSDSITGAFTSDGAVTRVAHANEPALLGALYEVDVVTQLLPLAAGWRGTATLFAVGPEESATVPVALRVTGEERVMIPDGSFDCWVVSVTIGNGGERLWVRKSDHVVIKASAPVIGMPDASVELLLASSKE